MSISASAIAQSLHSAFHRSGEMQSAPMQRRRQFEQHLQEATKSSAASGAGTLLSTDLLQAAQTVGTGK